MFNFVRLQLRKKIISFFSIFQDIRNFFGAKTTAKSKQVDNSKEATKKRGRAKPVVLSDSDEDDVKAPKNPKASKKKPVLSDSGKRRIFSLKKFQCH